MLMETGCKGISLSSHVRALNGTLGAAPFTVFPQSQSSLTNDAEFGLQPTGDMHLFFLIGSGLGMRASPMPGKNKKSSYMVLSRIGGRNVTTKKAAHCEAAFAV